MISVRLDVRGVNETRAFLANTQKAIKDATWKQVRGAGIRVYYDAIRRAPVDTGHLVASMYMFPHKDILAVEIGNNAEYSGYVEFGTSRTPAQPFLLPALAAEQKHFKDRLEKELADTIKETSNKNFSSREDFSESVENIFGFVALQEGPR